MLLLFQLEVILVALSLKMIADRNILINISALHASQRDDLHSKLSGLVHRYLQFQRSLVQIYRGRRH